MDLEAGIYHDDPEFEQLVDDLSNDLFQISSTNGKISEQLRRQRQREATLEPAMLLVQDNQLRFRQVKPEIERLQDWQEASPAQKYSQHKIAGDFGKLFAEFQRIQELVLDKARQGADDSATQKSRGRPASAIELSDQTVTGRGTAEDTSGRFTGSDELEEAPEQALAFEEQLRQDEISFQAGLVAEREQEIENVAQGMNELNEIYMNLGNIVQEQGVTLDNIESNIYTVAGHTAAGSRELTKAQRWQRRSTGRMLCFLMILLILGTVVVVAVSF